MGSKVVTSAPAPRPAGPSIAIIGAGIGGITLGIELDKRGLTNWTMYERDDGIGGTWYQNRYPGCRCDVPAIVYSHSSYPNPNWSQTHPDREEIQAYWANLAGSRGQLPRIKLRHSVVRADWDAKRSLYVIQIRDLAKNQVKTIEASILITASGGLSTPRYIELPGKENFDGKVIHAGDWPRDLSVDDLRGKTVVVVGNGCSGVQLVGTLGLESDINIVSLSRGRQWFVPSPPGSSRNSVPYSKAQNERWAKYPALQQLTRFIYCCVMDSHFYWYLEKDGKKQRKKIEEEISNWMLKELPEYMRDNAIPKHSFGAKRLIFEDGYFAALNKPNVKHIEGRIASLHGHTVVLDDGREMSADYVVLCTGYDAERVGIPVKGVYDSTEHYKSRAEVKMYHGVAIPGIPNFFNVLGNNMGLNHMSITTVIEIQTNYIGQLVQGMRDYRIPVLDVKRAPALEYDAWIAKELEKMTWMEVKNYWRGNDGHGRIFTHYPGSVRRLLWDNAYPVWGDYNGGAPVVRRQRLKRGVLALALVVAGYWATKTGLSAQAVQTLVQWASGLVAAGKALPQAVVGAVGLFADKGRTLLSATQ